MKYFQVIILFFLGHGVMGQVLEMPLNDGWQFRQASESSWMKAQVPGTVHTDLLANNKIEDPYFRMNEKELQWIEDADWEYECTFTIGSEILSHDKITLDFQGLDTYADVYLNDSLVLKANNMFRSWHADVSQIVRRGPNILRIYFHSPIKMTETVFDSLSYTIPVSANDAATKKLSIFTRKAPYHFGWDWGPRFVTSGIWRPVALHAWTAAKMEDVVIQQKELTEEVATLLLGIQYQVTRPMIGTLEVKVDGARVREQQVDLAHGTDLSNHMITINAPERWWPNGMGEQKLYDIEVILKKDDKIIDQYTKRTGLRTVELVQEDDRFGSGFYFKVNSQPVFAKGANYIPQDNFLPRVSEERYRHLLQSAADAHMNMIRVWGGGIYEEDIFYELCDELGLLVWQDFMFSCAMYPGDASFLKNVELEAIENVKRLRTHPSMALWCGNNESWMFWQNWRKNANPDGGQPKLWSDSGDSLKIVDAYNDIFRRILPNVVQAYGADIPYWESSPMSKNGGFPSLTSGDTHYWGVWWGQEPFHAYRENIGRFMSEYGFQSFPELATVDSFTVEQDWDIYSDVMEAHQKSSIGNRTIANYMDRHFRTPKDFENYLYLSQLLQAEGVKIAMEAHRLRRPYNMGSLYWQLNDCWPGASWSGIDYYGNWKALHYYARKAFAEVAITFEEDEHNITANIISDRPDEFRGTLLVELLDLNGKKIRSDEKKVRLKSYEGDDFWKVSKKELLKKEKPDEVILRAKLLENSVPLAKNHFLFVPHKEIDLPEPTIKFDLLKQEGGIGIQLKSNKTAFGVRLSTGDPAIKYSDNFFTLYPDETKTVTIQGNITLEALRERLVVHSLYDSYASE